MKKIILFLGLATLCGSLMAAQPKFKIPSDANNVKDIDRQWSGVETVYLATATTAELVVDANSNTITDGFVHWIIAAGTPTTGGDYLELRATGTANTTSARLIPRIFQHEISADNSGNQFIKFSPPIPFENGLSVNLNSTRDVDCEFAVGVGWKQR